MFHDKTIPYTLKKSRRARRMRLAVYSDGSVVLTTPVEVSENFAERFLRDKAEWLLSKISFFAKFGNAPRTTPWGRHADYIKKNKEAARVLIHRKLGELNATYGYRFNRVSIRNQKTCWGSCSRKGNLNFNYRILFLPERTQDYVIAHELCHLAEFNHSKKFWALVAKTSPEHLAIRKELRRSGMGFR